MAKVSIQQVKFKELRKHLVKWINERPGRWLLGTNVVDDVRMHIRRMGIHTTAATLAKELRKAERKGEIQKRIQPMTGYVEYMSLQPAGMLFDVGKPVKA